MYFSWKQHLELSRKVSNSADAHQGLALALMGVGLSMLAKDLLAAELLDHSNSHTNKGLTVP
ncbi:MAG: hypothetical protein P8O84_00455 [Synechococcus sp. cluster3_bin.96]|nr:hypothetical protein [Synechococcus sp. cluster3_bin.96]